MRVLLLLLLLSPSVSAATWYVRTDGGTTVQCTGHSNASVASTPNCAYANPQDAFNAMSPGDTTIVRLGDIYEGNFTLPNKGCTSGSPCTITTSGSLPSARVSPTSASAMPTFRTPNTFPTFVTATNAGFWILDGLEVTDNVTDPTLTCPNLIDLGNTNTGANNITLQRLYIHQKETGTNYYRSVIRAVQFEGNGLTYRWCYVGPIIGYYHVEAGFGTHTQMETSTLLSVTGNQMSVIDNYLSAWWNNIFLGGGDTPPQNTANLTGATTTSATFSNTTGLSAGVMIRFSLVGTGTLDTTGLTSTCAGQGGVWPAQGSVSSAANITRTSGIALTSSDVRRIGNIVNSGDSSSGLYGLCTVSGNTYTVAAVKSAFASSGSVSWVLYETAVVTSVVGSTVNFTPSGVDALASNGATIADWNFGDQGLISDVLVQKNTIYKDPAFAANVYAQSGATPKGVYEIKNVNRFTLDGNYIIGYPSICAVYPSNQFGTAPWITAKNVIIRNNWIAPDLGFPEGTREGFSIFNQDDYATITTMSNITMTNNLVKNTRSLVIMKKVNTTWSVTHNTVINTAPTLFSGNDSFLAAEVIPIYTFSDNIINYVSYGANCAVPPGTLATCWPAGIFSTNAVLNVNNSPDLNLNSWGAGGILSPILTDYANVGFVNQNSDNYQLGASSPYLGKGTSGTDPGVNWAALINGLGFNPSGGGVLSSRISGKFTASGLFGIGVASRTPTWFASPTGSGTACSQQSPCSLTTAAAGNSGAIHAGDIIYLRGGVYQVPVAPTGITFAVAGSDQNHLTVYAAYPGERPIITDAANNPPDIHTADYQQLNGLWIGGTRQTSDTADVFLGTNPISHWRQIVNCTFWGYYGGLLSGNAEYLLIQNNRFVRMGGGTLFHAIYISGTGGTFPGPAGTNTQHVIVDNNMCIAGQGGYCVHYFHNNRTGVITRNFVNGNWGSVFDGKGVLGANNFYWRTTHDASNEALDMIYTSNGLWINNILGLQSLALGPNDPATNTINKNAYEAGTVIGTNPITLTVGSEASQIGISATSLDNTIAAINTSFSASPTTILNDATIETNFAIIKNITVPNGSPLLLTGQPWFSAAATNVGPNSGAPSSVSAFWAVYKSLGLPEYDSNGNLIP